MTPEIRIAGIMRASAFSPNHIGADAAIFNAVAEQLRKRGAAVTIYSEEQLIAGEVTEKLIVDMCRERRSLEILQEREDEGQLVVNSGYGIFNCTRERMTRILTARGIPMAPSLVVNTNERIVSAMEKAGFERAWVKRGDFHARHKEDVCYVRHSREAQEVLQEFFMRGIPRAVIHRHVDGDLVKFYGVLGTKFFHWVYPYECHIVGEHEAIGGEPRRHPFDAAALAETCRKAAELLDVVVFGGDCIIRPDGSFVIIDFKDWPSFAPCRAQAAPHIARRILQLIHLHKPC